MDGRRRDSYLRPAIVAACLALCSAGVGLITGRVEADRFRTGSPPVDDPSTVATDSPDPSGTATTSIPTAAPTTVASGKPDFRTTWVDTMDLSAVRRAWNTARTRPRHRMNWTGSVTDCRPGETSPSFKADVLARVQWFRAMAGVSPAVTLNESSNRYAQASALVMSAADDLSHEPDSYWPCYSEEAFTGASHSNLFLGSFGVDAIDGYIEDSGEDNLSVGHRRWILDPTLISIGTGDTRNSNSLFVINEESNEGASTREPDGFVMWPPRGYVPRSQIYERWSVSHRTADFSDATVTVALEGRTRVFRMPYADTDGYGGLNSLTFEWRRPEKGSGPVHVTIDKIRLGGTYVSLRYEVLPFG